MSPVEYACNNQIATLRLNRPDRLNGLCHGNSIEYALRAKARQASCRCDGILPLYGSTIAIGIAQFWWTRSLSLAPPSAVVPFNYLSLVWAIILGFAVWGDVPTLGLLVGSAIVVASGVYILWRETVRRRRPAVPAPQRG
jgi:hypothetical protein